MVNRVRLLLVVACILGMESARAGTDIRDNLSFILAHNPLPISQGDTFVCRSEQKHFHELRFILQSSIRLYQTCLSSQDISGCFFVPSCSRYAMWAVEKYGVVHGVLMCSDRLLRCNAFGHKQDCPVDPKTGRFDDPVEANYPWDM